MSTPAERALALSILAIKLRAFAWGDVTSITIDDKQLAARASVAIDEMLEQREEALACIEVFTQWEFDQEQKLEREKAAEAIAASTTAARAKRADDRARVRAREAELVSTGGAIE